MIAVAAAFRLLDAEMPMRRQVSTSKLATPPARHHQQPEAANDEDAAVNRSWPRTAWCAASWAHRLLLRIGGNGKELVQEDKRLSSIGGRIITGSEQLTMKTSSNSEKWHVFKRYEHLILTMTVLNVENEYKVL